MTDEHIIDPIDLFDLPARVRNAVVREGLTTPQGLMRMDDVDLLAIYGIGPVSLRQVRSQLALWERDRRPAEETKDVDQAPRDPFPLLPGQRVLHAAWLPGAAGQLFLWAEGERLSDPGPEGHPFHVPPSVLRDALRDILPDGIPAEAGESSAVARLPLVDDGPQARSAAEKYAFRAACARLGAA